MKEPTNILVFCRFGKPTHGLLPHRRVCGGFFIYATEARLLQKNVVVYINTEMLLNRTKSKSSFKSYCIDVCPTCLLSSLVLL
jgi:hypothetical protein